MDLQKIFFTIFGSYFRISGGFGRSYEDAIVIYHDPNRDYVEAEYRMLELMATMQNYQHQVISQTLVMNYGRVYDTIKVKLVNNHRFDDVGIINMFYFDITGCFNRS
jgi:hypothetical protein